MKYLGKLLILILAITLTACSEDDNLIIASAITPPSLSIPASGSVVVLTEETASNIALTFSWSAADFDVTTVESYEVLMGIAGNDFATPHSFGTTSNTFVSITVEELNNLILDTDIFNQTVEKDSDDNTIPIAMEAKVIASLGSSETSETMESDVISFSIVPFEFSEPAPIKKFFVVGSFLNVSGYGNDWTPADAVPIAATADDDTNFEGFVNMALDGAQYKFLPTNESFDGDYGDTGGADGTYSGTLVQDGEVNCGTPDGTAGYYLVKMDIEGLTYSLEKTSWAVTGEATPNGWPDDADPVGSADQDMTYDTDTRTWILDVNLVAGAFKFRANDAWDFNLGEDNDGDGFMNFGGPDLSVDSAGNYRIVLDLSNAREYSYSVTLN